jgi:2-polyprenyl-3-methyl-5-hydroxy-6-metoxy-1,4-benzoquinol methylase
MKKFLIILSLMSVGRGEIWCGLKDERSYVPESSRCGWQGGISPEKFTPPAIPKGSKVLDVGAGNGIITEKIIDMVGKDNVWALEPSRASFEQLVALLGENPKYRQMTVQEALQSDPISYQNAFDVVTVIKYCVGKAEANEFAKALAKVLKPSGELIIMAVESDWFGSGDPALYVGDIFGRYFEQVAYKTIPFTLPSGQKHGVQYELRTFKKR